MHKWLTNGTQSQIPNYRITKLIENIREEQFNFNLGM